MRSQADAVIQSAWGSSVGPTRGPRPQFSLQDVAHAGVLVADEAGLDGLSLAKVAQRLGLTTTALYRYVPSKDVLIEVIADAAAGDVPELEGNTWQERASHWAQARAAQIRLHPWLTEVRPGGLPRLPNAAAWLEALLVAVADQPGVDGLRLALLLDTVATTYTRNFLAGAESAPVPDWLSALLDQRSPRLAQAVREAQSTDELAQAVAVVLRGSTAS